MNERTIPTVAQIIEQLQQFDPELPVLHENGVPVQIMGIGKQGFGPAQALFLAYPFEDVP